MFSKVIEQYWTKDLLVTYQGVRFKREFSIKGNHVWFYVPCDGSTPTKCTADMSKILADIWEDYEAKASMFQAII